MQAYSGQNNIFQDAFSTEELTMNGPPHSSDMSPPDFYLWGFLKDNVHKDNPKTIAALKMEITKKNKINSKRGM